MKFFHTMEKCFAVFPHNGKMFPIFSTPWKNPRAAISRWGGEAFTLVELLVVVAVFGLLAAILIGTLPAALGAARAAACRSNLRQLAAANLAYAADHGRYVAAAADIAGKNSIRWHGVRTSKTFDGAKGPLAEYLGGGGASAWVRRCPEFRPEAAGFESSCGGYGYNSVGVGSEVCLPGNGDKSAVGMRPGTINHPAETIMFADAAFLSGSGNKAKLIEYSFVEPPQEVGGGTPPWPTIHFRHRGKANVVWCDGHVSAETRSQTGARGPSQNLGWFGPDNNALFDPF
jgi:prepilin-type processing-associated H-X9-DG protein/prepilin-type N-terminal cleavage/methylation domain-containing protein